LNLTVDNILPDYSIQFDVLKKGQSFVVFIPEIIEFLKHCKSTLLGKLFNVTYSQVYTSYRNVGLQILVKGNKSSSVTHIFRHLKADTLRHSDCSEEVIKSSLHHKSLKSQIHYGQTTNKKSRT
jgi:hypothetical protein